MRIITLNANGIRAAARKGFFEWMGRQDADVVCIQETKAQRHQLEDPVFSPPDHHVYYHDAEKKGYSGLQVDIGTLSVISLYLPSGSSKEERQQFKYETMDYLQPRLAAMAADGRHYLICGDWNIAHRKIDIKNWRGNQKNSGFLPEERAWMDELFGPVGLADAFRQVDPREEQYTWWSNRGRAWDNNTGWRIDYQVSTPGLAQRATRAEIYKDQRFSDHSPVIMDYDFEIRGKNS